MFFAFVFGVISGIILTTIVAFYIFKKKILDIEKNFSEMQRKILSEINEKSGNKMSEEKINKLFSSLDSLKKGEGDLSGPLEEEMKKMFDSLSGKKIK